MSGPDDKDWGFPEVDPASTELPPDRDVLDALNALNKRAAGPYDTGSDAWWRAQADAQRAAATSDSGTPAAAPPPTPAVDTPPPLVQPQVLRPDPPAVASPLDVQWVPPEPPTPQPAPQPTPPSGPPREAGPSAPATPPPVTSAGPVTPTTPPSTPPSTPAPPTPAPPLHPTPLPPAPPPTPPAPEPLPPSPTPLPTHPPTPPPTPAPAPPVPPARPQPDPARPVPDPMPDPVQLVPDPVPPVPDPVRAPTARVPLVPPPSAVAGETAEETAEDTAEGTAYRGDAEFYEALRMPAEPPAVSPARKAWGALLAVAAVALGIGGFALLHDDSPKGTPTVALPSAVPTAAPTHAPSPTAAGTPAATSTAPPSVAAPPPAQAPVVPVEVLNNSRIKKLADRSAATFRAGGWPVSGTGNYRGGVLSQTTVYYGPGGLASAQRFARQFGIDRVLPRFSGLPGHGMTVVLTRYYG